jgi:branched-chain amino acid transport system permease protein
MTTILNSLSVGGIDALMAIGVALVFGIMRLANFAYGAIVMVTGYGLYLAGQARLPWPLMIVAVLLIGIGTSILTERLAFRPVRHAEPVTLLMTSFALAFFIQNAVQVIFSPTPRAPRLPGFATDTVHLFGTEVAALYLVAIAVAVFASVGLGQFLKRTQLGTEMRACAEDLEMARLMGVRPIRSALAAFGISGALAGVVGLLFVADSGIVTPDMGLPIAVVAFAGVVLGGMESLVGAGLGGFVIGALTTMLQTDLPAGLIPFHDAFVYGLVIAILLLRPQGILGGRGWAARSDAA